MFQWSLNLIVHPLAVASAVALALAWPHEPFVPKSANQEPGPGSKQQQLVLNEYQHF